MYMYFQMWEMIKYVSMYFYARDVTGTKLTNGLLNFLMYI